MKLNIGPNTPAEKSPSAGDDDVEAAIPWIFEAIGESPDRLCLDLPDAFACQIECCADFLERLRFLSIEPEPHIEHCRFARIHRPEHATDLLQDIFLEKRTVIPFAPSPGALICEAPGHHPRYADFRPRMR